jgi:hypothetical protein
MGAYNYAQYVGRAIGSALAQDYPPELIEIVVVDDGSTDSTAEVVGDLVRRNPDRVRLVRQANAGPTAATNRAISEAKGDLLCLLDADDIWLPQKTRRQVEMLQARPALGLVFADMIVVDHDEAVVRPSQIGQLAPLPQSAYARVLRGNFATQSSIMIRSSLRELFDPIPAEIPYADWWLTLRAAQVSEIDYSREPLALYREHGANLTSGVTGAAGAREYRKFVAFQLWALRHLPLDTLTPDEMLFVWNGVEEHARMVMMSAGSFFVELATVDPERVAQADSLLAEADRARADGDLAAEMVSALRALACNPFMVGSRKRLHEGVARANAAALLPHPLRGARRFVLLADAEDLLDGDDAMLAYAHALSGTELITLAIDASRLPADRAADDLHALVERCGVGDRADIDLLAVVGSQDAAQRHRMLSATHALYRREAGEDSELPVFTPSSLGQLRSFAQEMISPSGHSPSPLPSRE